MLSAWDKFRHLDAARQQRYRERAAWLQTLLGRLSAEQKADLRELPPRERATRLLELKDQLLTPSPASTSAPASQPASAPNCQS